MAKREIEFSIGEYYHIFNRGVAKLPIFIDKGDLYYFFDSIIISNKQKNIVDNYHTKGARNLEKEISKNSKKLVSVISYCLLPNHFHFIIREETDGGISKFMHKLSTSYVKYFNQKYERSGSLFQGKFKATHLSKTGSLLLTSAYVNLNYKHHKIDPKKNLVKSSLFEFLNTEKGERICDQEFIINFIKENFKNISGYKDYLKNQSLYFIERHDNNPDIIDFKELEN